MQPHRCGTVAIVGRPNVGKSTLLNRLLGQKIAIVSPKPETTRQRILGILTLPQAQILFLDTPGIYKGPKTLLAKYQIQAARNALQETDLLLLMTEAQVGMTDGDRRIVQGLKSVPGTDRPQPVFLAINKVDRVEKALILPQIEEAGRLYPFREIFPLSATKGDNVPELLEALTRHLPQGPALYPADQMTDQPMRALAQEIIREKALLFTHEEVPHAVAVLVEEWRAGKPADRRQRTQDSRGEVSSALRPAPSDLRTYIRATLYVERDSQKGILIGKGGTLLKKIGQAARGEIERLTGGTIFLDLWVKVAKNWRKDAHLLKQLGYD